MRTSWVSLRLGGVFRTPCQCDLNRCSDAFASLTLDMQFFLRCYFQNCHGRRWLGASAPWRGPRRKCIIASLPTPWQHLSGISSQRKSLFTIGVCQLLQLQVMQQVQGLQQCLVSLTHVKGRIRCGQQTIVVCVIGSNCVNWGRFVVLRLHITRVWQLRQNTSLSDVEKWKFERTKTILQ